MKGGPRPGCPVCGDLRVRAKPFHYLFGRQLLRALGCARCGVIFLHPQPTAEELKGLYSREYFEGGDFRCGHEGSYTDPDTLERLVDRGFLERIRRAAPGGRFLEIGCAGGALLAAARDLGYDVQGVELSPDASRAAGDRFGLPVFTGEIEEAHFPDGSFEIILMGDVLEHLPDPVRTLREVHRLLASGGLLVLAVPSQTNSLFSRIGFLAYGIARKSATVALPPYHLFEYRPGSLRHLLRLCGFRIKRLRQGIISPRRVHIRGPVLERIGKKLLQYPNWVLTGAFGVLGDRLEVFAVKEGWGGEVH